MADETTTTSSEVTHGIPGALVYDDVVYPTFMQAPYLEEIKTFDLEGDCMIVSYPKTGCTWLQEIVWLIDNNIDIAKAKRLPNYIRVNTLENQVEGMIPPLASYPHPRVVRSHVFPKFFSKEQLEGRLKIITIIRDPRDTLVSFYHFYRMNSPLGMFKNTWDAFFEVFKAKQLVFGDFFEWYRNWFDLKPKLNMLVLRYEDLKADVGGQIRKIADFLGKDVSEKDVDTIVDHVSFENMKENKMVNYETMPKEVMDQEISPFMRKGEIGDWKNYFNDDQNMYIKSQMEQLPNEYRYDI